MNEVTGNWCFTPEGKTCHKAECPKCPARSWRLPEEEAQEVVNEILFMVKYSFNYVDHNGNRDGKFMIENGSLWEYKDAYEFLRKKLGGSIKWE